MIIIYTNFEFFVIFEKAQRILLCKIIDLQIMVIKVGLQYEPLMKIIQLEI